MKKLFFLLAAMVLPGCIHNRSNVTYVYSPASTDGRVRINAEGSRRVDADKSVESAVSGAQTGSPSASTNGDINGQDGKAKAGEGTGKAQGGAVKDAKVQ